MALVSISEAARLVSRFYRRLSKNAYPPSQTPPKRENEPLEDEIAKPSERHLNHN